MTYEVWLHTTDVDYVSNVKARNALAATRAAWRKLTREYPALDERAVIGVTSQAIPEAVKA